MLKNKKSKGGESKHKYFYVVRQSPPTSTPPSKLSLKISLSKPPKASNAYNWLPRCQWTFTTRDYLQSLHPSLSQHLQPLNMILQKWLQIKFPHTMCLITNESSMCVNELNEYKFSAHIAEDGSMITMVVSLWLNLIWANL